MLAAPLLGGCRSAWYSARFAPAPVETELLAQGEPVGQARGLVSVRGIRRSDASKGEPARVEVLLRIDNLGQTPVTLLPDRFDLVSADLVSFQAPQVQPAPGEPIAVGEKRAYQLVFRVPADKRVEDLDWSGLNVTWTVSFDGREVTSGVTFDRVQPANATYYGADAFWGPTYWPVHDHVPHSSLGTGGNFEDRGH